ncbi:MAG: hypothetical protein A3C93_02745 [Candidatus Lloydbacteria bacterium RIFCSPHIGHO2_02_FULL_54_17]|uniref:Uncharacterized protein n=1 Tax=Candidatus Lloydbacteria bacterium RIFCSPHIGHO2_02_FULL_54_17 TaxID=1798664 RepID=A0A1G2DBC7_9BACT|nr:MAG: hypothetical protein A2762_05995 [Candidatus Lloydbacteria bacterium RIFCSPHIGHO2_01_FULL_54_11]OGZ10937.1 MAG: hypothetical protein A3C93_02745 [Candidatus Lloydbacteria bacterium RIFCSPHIGHO2_02_FULL_54_17]OGZ14918.1 MAG: hypothetical protein A2948_05340 [Candidatus Lloydbacteria bacterium RIFCSPLOWO2_01_FULL_54_18]OGZ17168.1 MAG: hypothetical protein A3H76_04120 [Candidatus Lloydbacteria bacterium RIFCSPLOWO2_02_FULL_54_12]
MIVAIGIFVTILIIIIGALVSVNDAARKARSMRVVTENLSAAIDSMSRTIRVGKTFHCDCSGLATTTPQDCKLTMTGEVDGGGDVCLAFEGQLGVPTLPDDQISYKLSGRSIVRSIDNGATYLPLTAPELGITDLKFFVDGTTPGFDQPVITIVVRGSASTTRRTATSFNVQTTVGAYTPNLPF